MREGIDRRCAIAVMAKASAPGRTKTRLCPPLTPEEAASMNTAFLRDVADNLLDAGSRRPISGAMAFGPAGAAAFFEHILPPGIEHFEACLPNFGECLVHALDVLLRDARNGSAVVLNADSPTLPVSLLVETARVLAEPGDRIVLGPSTDGGYYLLGLRTLRHDLFREITWSTDAVAEQTLTRAREIGVPVHMLPAWYDVDDADALRMLVGELFEERPFSSALTSGRARHSACLLRELLDGTDLAKRLGVAWSHAVPTTSRPAGCSA